MLFPLDAIVETPRCDEIWPKVSYFHTVPQSKVVLLKNDLRLQPFFNQKRVSQVPVATTKADPAIKAEVRFVGVVAVRWSVLKRPCRVCLPRELEGILCGSELELLPRGFLGGFVATGCCHCTAIGAR
jgi:hypothetical protein